MVGRSQFLKVRIDIKKSHCYRQREEVAETEVDHYLCPFLQRYLQMSIMQMCSII